MYCMHEHTYQEKCHTIHILSVSAPLIYTSQTCHKYIYIYIYFFLQILSFGMMK